MWLFIDIIFVDRRLIFYQECVLNCLFGKYLLIENIILNYRFECVFKCLIFLVYYIFKCLFKCYKFCFFILQLNRICVFLCFMGFIGYNYICIERCFEYVLYIENGICVLYCVNMDFIYILINIGRKCLSFNFCINEIMLIKGIKICI